MLNSVLAHIKLVQRNDIFGEVIPNAVIGSKFAPDGFFGCEQIGDLDIQLLSAFFADKIKQICIRDSG